MPRFANIAIYHKHVVLKNIARHPDINISVHFDIKMRFIGETFNRQFTPLKMGSVQCDQL
jgi:hypothetical protein